MPDMDTLSWYSFGVPAYVLYVLAEIALARRRPEKTFGFAETISNLTAGLGTLIIGLFAGPWVTRAWDLAHDHLAPFRWPDHGWWRLPAALLLGDFCYYAYHRAGHRFALFWSIHGIHHQHEHLNSSVGFRLEWLADPYAALFFGLMPLAGIDSTTGFAALAVLSFYALTAHTPTLPRPSWGLFVTPTIHGAHHSRDARFDGKNFGAMLTIWDRLLGTLREPPPGDRLAADLPSISRTHDGVTTQWGLLMELARALRGTPTLGAKVRLLFSPPTVRAPATPLRDDAALGRPTSLYVLVHFVALAVFAAWLLLFRELRPLSVQVASSLAILAGLHALGGLLDGRPSAMRDERLRLFFTITVGAAIATHSLTASAALVALGVLGLGATLLRLPLAASPPSPP